MKVLTDLSLKGRKRVVSFGKDRSQSLATIRSGRGVTRGDGECPNLNNGEGVWGWSCRAENAEGDGGESRECERAHDEWLRSVVKE